MNYFNLGLAHQGRLLSDLFAYPQQSVNSLMTRYVQYTDMGVLMSRLYYQMGVIGAAQYQAFSSCRMDGLFTRLYFTYIDADGVAHKPFLLPQKNPVQFYDDLMLAYNIPEFIKDKVEVNQQIIARMMKETDGIDVTYK